ncbi:MAG: hypothetical protein LBH93_05100 [Chitinispirillales bacterium]|nr:hypothetical protein [Chitinispirillales bacterium]
MWRLKPPHKVNVKVKGGGVDGFDFDGDVDVVGALRATPVSIGRGDRCFDFDFDFVWRLCATRYEAVGFV